MSSDNNMELSRRKILGSIGAVGAAGAGAGLGTSALFSDTEEFANNQLTAGQLDLNVDWEEHYSYPQIYDDFGDPTIELDNGDEVNLDVTRSEPTNPADYNVLPDPEMDEPLVWANTEDDPIETGQSSLELYFQNTTIEAFPDRQDGEVEATFTSIDSGGNPVVSNPCSALADVPQDLSTYADDVSPPARTRNADTYDSNNDEAYPLLNLQDVKPGDFGEFTFSAHICDNPGYLWLQMPGGLEESENGLREPEEDPDFGNDGSPDDGELAENVKTALWYDDDCNNRIQPEPNDLVTLAVVDTSGSTSDNLTAIEDAANALVKKLFDVADSSPVEIYAGVITFENTGDSMDPILANPIVNVRNYVDSNGDGIFDGQTILPPDSTGGNSPIAQALDTGRMYLNEKADALDQDSSNDVEDPDKELLLVSDGQPSGSFSGTEPIGTLQNPDGMDAFDPGSSTTAGLFSAVPNGYTFPDASSLNTPYESDYFDGKANDSDLELPESSPPVFKSQQRAELVLVARDIDGAPFFPNTQYAQPAGPKMDKPDGQLGDDKAIDGENDITVRAAAVYASTAGADKKQTSRDMATAIASEDADYDLPKAGGTSTGKTIADDITGGGTGEEVIFRGTLRELENELTDPALRLEGPLADGCYSPGATHCFGLAWWVPTEVGNEIQSDSVGFDLSFLTEQCRNNDDPGQTVL